MNPQECNRILTVQDLFAQAENVSVLRHLGLHQPADVMYFDSNTDGSPYDEGGQIFFHRYGKLIPAMARCSTRMFNLLVHERTARIFALLQGRFTIALRPDFSRPSIHECFTSSLRGETMDGTVDLSQLGSGWVLFSADTDEEAQAAFVEAYELAGE